YPEHKLIKSFERLDGEELLSSDANTVNQLLDENRIIYTVWDNNTTYLLDLSNNTETALGTALLTPCFSPDGKYFAYASQDSFLPGFYLYDLGNDETFYYEVGENEYPRIIGWAKKDNMINTNN
ncbi:MAG: hypothetical protein RRY35_07795, partial [Clostridiales bacterium]